MLFSVTSRFRYVSVERQPVDTVGQKCLILRAAPGGTRHAPSEGMDSQRIWGREDGATEEDRLVERFTRRESPEARSRRIAHRAVDPETAEALRRLWAA